MTERFVEIDGHRVDADTADLFYNMDDGSRVSDDDWDESKRRVTAMEAIDADPENPVVTWEPIAPEVPAEDIITPEPVRDWNGDGGKPGPNT